MKVYHNEDEEEKFFFILDDEAKNDLGEMFYREEGRGIIVITHTFINSNFKGKGLGKLLMDEVADFARKKNLKIIPQCPFAKALIEKYPEKYGDLLAE